MLDDLSRGLRDLRDLGKDASANREARRQARAREEGPTLFVPAELMGKEVTGRCSSCQRTIRNKVEVLAMRLATNRTRCETCGGKLEMPPEVHAVLERSSQEHAREAEARAAVHGLTCPVCNRGVSAPRPGVMVKCSFCSVSFQATAQGRAAPPPSGIPPAEPRELEPHLRRLKGHEPLAANLLGQRAGRGEVSLAEAVTLAARFDALAAWSRSPSAERLPFPPEEVPPLVANLVFPGQMFLLEPQDLSDGGTMIVSAEQQGSKVSSARVLTNVLSLATLAAGGGGLFFLDLDGGPGQRVDVVLDLHPGEHGTELSVQLARNGKRSACPAKMLAGWKERVEALGPPLRRYLLRCALFGPWAMGAPLFMVTAEAATARLRELSAEAPRALEALGFGA